VLPFATLHIADSYFDLRTSSFPYAFCSLSWRLVKRRCNPHMLMPHPQSTGKMGHPTRTSNVDHSRGPITLFRWTDMFCAGRWIRRWWRIISVPVQTGASKWIVSASRIGSEHNSAIPAGIPIHERRYRYLDRRSVSTHRCSTHFTDHVPLVIKILDVRHSIAGSH
jgi:hypothetical protein